MGDIKAGTPIRSQLPGQVNYDDVVVKIGDGTTPSQLLGVDSSGRVTIKLTDGTGNAITSQVNGAARALDVGINVAGVQIDPRQIRALTTADAITTTQGPAAATHASPWWMHITDGTNDAGVLATGELKVSVTQPLPTGTNSIGKVAQDNTTQWVTSDLADGPVTPGTVAAKSMLGGGQFNTVLPTLTAAQQAALQLTAKGELITIQDVGGAPVSATNPLPVAFSSAPIGSIINNYNTAATIAANATSNHDYTVTSSKTFQGKKVWGSASGLMKIEVQTSPDGTTFSTLWVGFNSAADPNITIDMDQMVFLDSGAGAKVRVIRTNLDGKTMDVYSTISGTEV